MENSLYFYNAKVVKVYDGDTITVDIDLGLKTWIREEVIRLYGINAPELRGVERAKGLESRDFLRSQILQKHVLIKTLKYKGKEQKGKYGRYLGIVFLPLEGNNPVNINELMVENGFAEYKNY